MPPHLGALNPMATPVAPPSRGAQPDLSSLPPRLRERLEREYGRNKPATSSMRNWLIGVGVVATLGITLILLQRFGAIDWPILRGAAGSKTSQSVKGPEGTLATPGHTDRTAAIIDSLKREVDAAKHTPPVHTAATPKEVSQPAHARPENPAESGTAETPTPATATETKAAVDTKPTETAAEPESGTYFGIGVSSYLEVDRAREEKDRLVGATSLPGLVMPYTDEGSTMYRVVLGKWATAGDAERASNALMERGLISAAQVVALPKK